MTFIADKNVAIVWFSKSFLQLAFTVDDFNDESPSISSKSPNENKKEIYCIKMEQFQPLNERQHFLIHSILSKNSFTDSFILIESLSHPGYFLNATEDISNENTSNKIFISREKENATKWQFIDGQLFCNNGQTTIIFDSEGTYSLKTIKTAEFNQIKDNNNNTNEASEFDVSESTFPPLLRLYEESTFHFCFYDGNSIPDQVPIFFYSPLYHKVITLVTSGDLNNGGHWLRLEKYDSHMPTQVWIHNLTHQNDIRSSVEKDQAFDYYNDGHRYLLYTHLHHGRPNQQWDYQNYTLITHENDHLVVEFDNELEELKMREDVEKKTRQDQLNDNGNDNNDFKLSECDIFSCSNVFLIFLSNQRTMFNYSPDLDTCYLYNPLLNNKFHPGVKDDISWISFDEFRGNIWDNYASTSDYEKDYKIVTFKNNPDETIKLRNVTASFNYRYNYYNHNLSRVDFTQVKNWKDFNCYLNKKISITSDQRVFIHNVELSDNCSVTFSLIMKGELLSNYKRKNTVSPNNGNNYRSYDDYEDSFDIDSDEENTSAVYISEREPNIPNRIRNDRYHFESHRVKPKDNEKKDWQPEKYRFPEAMNDLQTQENRNNNNRYVNANYFLPFGFNRLRRRQNVPINVNQDENNNDNNDDQNLEIKLFDEKIVPSDVDDHFKLLLEGSPITITKENSSKCRSLGSQLGITGMVEVADFVDSFSPQFARVSDLAEIQKELMEINETNYEQISNNILKNYMQNYDYSTICWLILSIAITKPYENDSLARFCQLLLQNTSDEFKAEFKKTILRDFNSININAFFYSKVSLYCEDLFNEDEKKIIEKLNADFFEKEISKSKQKVNDPSEIKICCQTGFNSGALQKIIRNDDVDKFQRIFIVDGIKPDMHFHMIERVPLLNRCPTLIQYAAFFGSIKIFKFLLLQKASLTTCDLARRNSFTFALAGGNTEIIHIIQQELKKTQEFNVTTDLLRNAIKYGQNDVFKWLLTNTSQEMIDKISKRDLVLEAILSKNINAFLDLIEYINHCESICVHFSVLFNNIEFLKLLLPFYIENKFSLICDAAISGNVDILRYLIENIKLDQSLKDVAVKTAINFDNVEVFKYLATEDDYSCSNFIYACECNSISIVELFLDDNNKILLFDFSNILINDCPLSFELVMNKKQKILDILVDSKYFDFNEKYQQHSLFYYAVANQLFDFARKIFDKQKGLYDINEEGLLLEYAHYPEIVHFLVSFPELDVNIKDSKFSSVIDILYGNIIDYDKEKIALSISYLLDRSELKYSEKSLLIFSIEFLDNFELFEKIIQKMLAKGNLVKHDIPMYEYIRFLDSIVRDHKIDFFIKFIKSGLVDIEKNKLINYCIQLSSPKVYHEICHDELPKEKEIFAICNSITKSDFDCFSYLMGIVSIDFNSFNNYIPNSDQTILTFAIKNAKDDKIIDNLLTNKLIDVNKPNKLGESPFYVSLCRSDPSIQKMMMNHSELKLTFKEIELAFDRKNTEVIDFIIKNLKCYVDDPSKIIKIIFDDKSFDYLHILASPREDNEEEQKNLLPLILISSVKHNLKTFFKTDLEDKIDRIDTNVEDPENKGATSLCYAIYQRGIYFFNNLKNYHPLLQTNDFNIDYPNESRITPFGNVRSLEDAKELIKLMIDKKVPIELMIKEISGLNVKGQTALYASIVENNFILFEYLLKLSNELNRKLENNEELVDALIYAKNRDGNNPFFAICMNNNWQYFINHLLDKLVKVEKDYFGSFGPLSAAIISKNMKLINILLSKGFEIDHYSFNQILRMNLYNSLGIRLLKAKPDFKFDLFMPLHLIENEEIIENLFAQKRIDFDFRSCLPSDEYLLLSAIKSRNEKLVHFILNNDYDKIIFDWKDIHGKTALHYAIEKSMTKIVFLLIDIFTAPNTNRFDFFCIEDENSETPIHYLFKSFNEDYVSYFYKHALPLNQKVTLKTIFNEPTLINKVIVDISKETENSFDSDFSKFNSSPFESQDKIELVNQKETKIIKETFLTFAIKSNKVKFIKFLLQNIPEIDPNAVNSENQTPLQISLTNPIIFELLIEICCQKVSSSENDLDVNKNEIAFSIISIDDSKLASFYLNLLLKCENFDVNQKTTLQIEQNEQKEVSLFDWFIKKINIFDDETKKSFLFSPKFDFNSNPNDLFELIKCNLQISLTPILKRLNDETIKNARTDDDEKDTVATLSAKNISFLNVLNSEILDPRIDFVNSKNAKGKSAIDILKEKGQSDLIDLILSLRK